MDDSELDAIRAKRLVELQHQTGQQRSMGNDPNDKNSVEEQRQKQEDMRNAMLSSLLTQEARARLNTISLTKPEKGRMVEDILIQNARRGAFGGGKVIEYI
jgi:programmed cell death protein 5